MCSGYSLLLMAALAGVVSDLAYAADLRVCADPNNLPFSNRQQQGFENEIARLAAKDLGRTVSYVWAPDRGESFVRKTLLARRCDVLMGIPSNYRQAAPTTPYYRSTYVFVSRLTRHLKIHSLNDPALRRLRIGVHVISDDASNLPPAQALANRGMYRNVAAYSMYGDSSKPNPPAALIHAVAHGDIDLAIAWGPLAGYFAERSATALELTPVAPAVDRPFLPFTYSISMGVRPGDRQLLSALNAVIQRRSREIHAILGRYGVPMLDDTNSSATEHR